MFKVEKLDPSVKAVIYGLHAGDFNYRYIGLSVEPAKRFRKHLAQARSGENRHVCNWIMSHGPENIQMCIIETFEEDSPLLDEREMFLIAQYNLFYADGHGGMNGTRGGRERAVNGYIPTAESNAARSERMKGQPSFFKGRTHSDETKELMRQKKLGKEFTQEHRDNIGKAHRGKKLSEEQKTNLSVNQKGRPNKGHHTRWCINAGKPRPDCTFCVH